MLGLGGGLCALFNNNYLISNSSLWVLETQSNAQSDPSPTRQMTAITPKTALRTEIKLGKVYYKLQAVFSLLLPIAFI